MKTKIATTLIATMLLLTLAGCNKTTDTDINSDAQSDMQAELDRLQSELEELESQLEETSSDVSDNTNRPAEPEQTTATTTVTTAEPEPEPVVCVEIPETDIEYYYDEERQGMVITGYCGEEIPKHVIYPFEIEGKPVVGSRSTEYWLQGATTVEFPDNFTKIPADALGGTNTITNIVLPDTVTKIERAAFSYADITNIDLPNNVITIDTAALADTDLETVNFPKTVTQIGAYAFKKTNLETVILPPNLDILKEGTFSGCDKLTSVTLNDNLKVIEQCAFEKCVNLREITLPDNIEYIDNFAFAYCDKLIITYRGKEYRCQLNGVYYEDLRNAIAVNNGYTDYIEHKAAIVDKYEFGYNLT